VLEHHRELALLDLIVRECLELCRETNKLAQTNEPLCGIILEPADCVAIVAWEFVVEIMVTLTERKEGGDHVVARSVLVVEGCLAKPVCDRVDAES